MYTMIIADDEYELRKALIEMIDWTSLGFEVVGEAENGVEALELVERLEPDLLLTDIKMPFISGIDLARKVRETRPSTHIVFLSGYDDFSYAQQAIEYNIIKYLLKPISKNELTEEFKGIKESMDKTRELFMIQNEMDVQKLQLEQFLMPLLFDREYTSFPIDEEKIEKKALELDLIKETSGKINYMVIVTRLFEDDKKSITTKKHLHAVDTIVKKHLQCGSFYSQGKIISLLVGMSWEIEKYIDIVVNEIVQTTKKAINQDCYIGISSIVSHLSKSHLAYDEACNALEYGRGTQVNICFIEDIERKNVLGYNDIEKVTMNIEKMLKSNQDVDIEKYISDVFLDIITKKATGADIDLLMIHIISSACTLIHSICDESSSNQFFNQVSQIGLILSKPSYNDKRKAIIDFCFTCKNLIHKQKRVNSEIICDELMELINRDYSNEDLSLTIVSEQLHMSASYLSALIKKGMKENFVSLLTKKRMEVAKELVLYSSSKIIEVARLCGYSDQHYFSYCFKRQYGMSPNKMREQYANEK